MVTRVGQFSGLGSWQHVLRTFSIERHVMLSVFVFAVVGGRVGVQRFRFVGRWMYVFWFVWVEFGGCLTGVVVSEAFVSWEEMGQVVVTGDFCSGLGIENEEDC